jgi:YOP proteins translocation protein K (YscK)
MLKARAEPTIDMGRHLMAFNWLPAAYAHSDWLGDWAGVLNPRDGASLRTIQRASLSLLDRYNLRERYVRDAGHFAWLLQSHQQLSAVANALAVAMLGGWVKSRLERTEVALQHQLLGTTGRQEALRYAHELKALPNFKREVLWPEPPVGAQAVLNLGLSCMAALLQDGSTGARERFTLRFPMGAIHPVALTNAQAKEALDVIEHVNDDPGVAP